MTLTIFILAVALIITQYHEEKNKTERIKYLSSIEGITPADIINILNKM